MKIALAFLLLAIPVFAAEPTRAQKEVLATVESWKQAMIKGDAAALGKIYHDEITYEHSSGKTEVKNESIANATKPGSLTKAIEFHELTTRVIGDTALVKGVGDFTNAAGAVTHLDVLMVFLKSGQGWQMIARQSTKLP